MNEWKAPYFFLKNLSDIGEKPVLDAGLCRCTQALVLKWPLRKKHLNNPPQSGADPRKRTPIPCQGTSNVTQELHVLHRIKRSDCLLVTVISSAFTHVAFVTFVTQKCRLESCNAKDLMVALRAAIISYMYSCSVVARQRS